MPVLAVCAGTFAFAEGPVTVPPGMQVVWLGEVHDNPRHHEIQANVVASLAPSALVFEMLSPEQAARVTSETRADLDALGGVLDWSASGWPDWSLYSPIFAAAPEAAIYGAARAPGEIRRAVTEGAFEVYGEDGARFGLDQPLGEKEAAMREQGQAEAHCDALPVDLLPGMVEAQRLRDADLAAAALEALEETGGPVAVITGTGHVRGDWGAPALLSRAAPDVEQFLLGQVEGDLPDEAPFDLVLTAPSPDRPDPCAAFR
ncbi:hypothetical protein jaqu_36820 [Jannaschia aquimarina]|uniref:Haem-binding uptake Tiki superfamily ChaN domain-containing protein n=1 Tax=Jannaschia aquimarina TaxID=935700 RepID=A0A0D1EA91_9RHOB|nr:hypothetical protein jaqu_36820 [Jannaschia aquimarina]SNS77302.1 Uncharacterized iron-regulated protein [Jannaschia aquimarina]